MHIYGENIMKNLSFLTLFAFLSVGFVVADEPVDEDVEVVTEATMSESSDAADDEDVQELGRVSVTGSRIKRVDIEGATPLITITRADIDNAGFQTVYDAVVTLLKTQVVLMVRTSRLVLMLHCNQSTLETLDQVEH